MIIVPLLGVFISLLKLMLENIIHYEKLGTSSNLNLTFIIDAICGVYFGNVIFVVFIANKIFKISIRFIFKFICDL